MSKPIIVVFTATGKSGGGMIDYMLKDGSFAARAVTRNPNSESAKALAAKGVEVVKGDFDDSTSIANAMEGAYGVFGVTDFWTAFHKEEDQGKSLVDAAKKAGIKHFVWLTLDYSEWHVPHFETKARVNDYLIASGVPRTSIYTSYFAENFKSPFFPFKRDSSGKVAMDVPYKTDGKLPIIAATDIGGWAIQAFTNPDQWIGKDMKICNEWLSPREVAKMVSETIGEDVQIKEVDDEAFNAIRNPETEEMWLNLQCFYTGGPNYRDVEMTHKLLPGAKTTKQFIQEWGTSIVQ